MKYAVGIPTCDRPKELKRVVEAFLGQTVSPSMIVIVNNNSNNFGVWHDADFCTALATKKGILVARNNYPTLGPEQAHQTCLDYWINKNLDIAVRWDDDLVPATSCMENLLSHFGDPNINCVGGCYPREGKPVWEGGPLGGLPSPDGNPNHVQFFEWGQATLPLPVKSLYSGFAYRVKKMVEVGGFCTEYSRMGFRGETDATLRLGGCLVEPKAIALHLLAKGGIRAFGTDELQRLDTKLFEHRMKDLGIVVGEKHV